jgi:hypothetical protein
MLVAAHLILAGLKHPFSAPMYILLVMLLLFLANNSAGQTATPETHLREAGTGAIFLRSAFAHGYRHGYEEGYHLGNIDINMGRHPRTKPSQFRDLSSRYSPDFGPRKSFEAGFQEGLKAGYSDGFVGRRFRAVENLRLIATSLDQEPPAADPVNAYFDQGVSTGYTHGLNHAQKDPATAQQLDPGFAGCTQVQLSSKQDIAAQGSFCDGYRRGYMLGHADGIILNPDASALAARK